MVFRSVPKIVICATVYGAFAMTAASAATITMTYQESSPFGAPNLHQSLSITSVGYTGPVAAGPFQLTGSNGYGDFVGFCIDLANDLNSGTEYVTASVSKYGAAIDANIALLFGSAYAGVDTAVEGAAFQVALWEIITEGTSGFDLASGDFSATGNTAVTDQATSYLAGLVGAVTGQYDLSFLNSNESQDLVTVSAVPVPAALGMLGLGMAGLFGVGRRKKA